MRFHRHKKPKTPLPDRLTLDVLRFSHDGRGIAEKDGRVVMVSQALPGEQVVARIEKGNTRLWQGRTLDVITASEQRIKPECSHFGRCGGCQMQHVGHAGQLEIKQQAIADHFRRNGMVDLPWQDTLVSKPFEYRHRARLHVSPKGKIGFHNEQGNQVIAIDSCPVFRPELQAAFERVKARAPLAGLKQLELVVDDFHQIGAVALKGRPQAVSGFHDWVRSQDWSVDSPLRYQSGNCQVMASPGEFTQVNREINQTMLQRGADWLELVHEDRLLDLFCGNGNFACFLQNHVSGLLGLEGSSAAISKALSAVERASHSHFDVADLFEVNVSELPLVRELNPTVVVLDPPRAGSEKACQDLLKIKSVEKTLYISCDPATLARDIKILAEDNWHLRKIALIDMFPQTRHIETMVLLDKN